MELEDTIVLGDFNAHHELWDPFIPRDPRGEDLVDQIDISNYGILNERNYPTRKTAACQSSPDLTLASANYLPVITWNTDTTLGSDHLPIILTLNRTINKIRSEKKTYINFVKANWTEFERYTEQSFSETQIPNDVIIGEKTFRNILDRARKLHIPSGRILDVLPNFPSSAVKLADERDIIRAINPADPKISELNKDISKLVYEHKKTKWLDHLNKSSFYNGPKNLWKTTKNLMNNVISKVNNAINFDDVPVLDPKICAKLFNCQFTTHPDKQSKEKRQVKRKFNNYSSLNKQLLEDLQLTTDDVTKAIKATSSSKAMGPDDLSPIMLKHLGPNGVKFLTCLLNLSLETLKIPQVWKTARIVPLLKPGKNSDQAKSYRPISLLSPVAKLLEKLLLPAFTDNIELADHQHGFRKNHSTTTALHQIHGHISYGLNQKQPCRRTIMVALDMSRAFDTVALETLLDDIFDTTLPPRIKRWTYNYLIGRQTFVEFRNSKSYYRRMKQGVPQGGVLSPTLFNLYISKMPTPLPGIKLVSYADDITLLVTGNNIEEMTEMLNTYLVSLNTWMNSRNLKLSPEKSTSTLFTTWTLEMSTTLNVSINEQQIPTVRNPKILGVNFDPMLTFKNHTTATISKLKNRNNILKKLAGTNWGKEKETMITAYKSICRPLMNYAAPIWTPQLRKSHWTHLQTCQNAALRISTGCLLMANEDHLHTETNILPVQIHNTMLTEQYLASSHKTSHPCNNLVVGNPPPRNLRKSVIHLKPNIANFLPAGTITPEVCKAITKDIHTKTVENTISRYKPNRVLREKPPAIAKEETELPRTTRSKLAQLRSGFSRMLNSYQHRLDPTIDDKCEKCGESPHDTAHLFDCHSNPTTLTPIDLWTHPKETAQFLNLDVEPALKWTD